MTEYSPSSIEPKWQRIWEEKRCFEPTDFPERPEFYSLEMLPYPSGQIHMGHVRNYAIGDAMARFKRMRGFDVMHPMGWDSFGLPAENAAIERGIHPKEWTESNIAQMRAQLKRMGFAYAWSREIAAHNPDYYRWNQWLFIRMFRKDLAYRSLSRVNWCPSCATVLANEQVEQGGCWRCQSEVQQKELEQWFLRTSRYAQELLEDLERLTGWPEQVVAMQRNWIGRSEGAFLQFPIEPMSGASPRDPIRVFTTRVDTIYGATFLALSPDHPAVERLIEGSPQAEPARRFLREHGEHSRGSAGRKLSTEREKAGVFTGRHAVNPFNRERVPIWIANFVLMDYGTGAIMAVPAHDERDFEFATRYDLPIRKVIAPDDGSSPQLPFTLEEASTVDSGPFSGLSCAEAQMKMALHAEQKGFGEGSVQYRLKDWGISRQRYWGTPIPMLYCERCGVVPVPESDLPVVLPADVQFTGKGGNPLGRSPSFIKAPCPACGGAARRETDTMDTFVDSSWYFYRYLDPRNTRAPFRPESAKAWLPVDLYVGGIEHAILHLMYARFFSKVMRDLELGAPGEPVTRLLCQGMVQKDGATMSKSRGNVVPPNEMVEKYGADVTRLFILFAAPPEKHLDWSEGGIEGLQRFAKRVWRLVDSHAGPVAQPRRSRGAGGVKEGGGLLELRRKAHQTLARVTDDIDRRLHLNTAIAGIMELVNRFYALAPPGEPDEGLSEADRETIREALEIMAFCLAPFAPHLAEEAWSRLGHQDLLATHAWPAPEPSLLTHEQVTIVVQVNGKVRGRVEVPVGADEASVVRAIREDHRVSSAVFPGGNAKVVKTVFVPDRLLNVVVAR